jgi:diguanylate cyclase (GGDEF)-like protein
LWFFLPGGLLYCLGLAFVYMARLQPLVPGTAAIAPYAVLAVATLLGWRFNRSRLVYGVAVLFLAGLFLARFPVATSVPGSMGRNVLNCLATLLPVNLAIIFLIHERGLTTARGLWRLALLAAQPLAVFLVFRHRADLLPQLFAVQPVHLKLPVALPLAQVPMLALLATFVLFLGVALKRRGVLDYGFLWALTAGFTALLPWQNPRHATLFFAVAGLILVISAVEEAYAMAFKDELTGLPARRALNEDLLKLGSRYTVAMVDIDFFKKFNDKYGHDVGDQVLRMVAGTIARVTGGGRAYRYGGEEFTLLFPGIALDDALPHLERLRQEIQGAGFTLRGQGRPSKKPTKARSAGKDHKRVGITVSIGAAEPRDRQEKHQQVIKAADKALYQAKKRGRNQVAIR